MEPGEDSWQRLLRFPSSASFREQGGSLAHFNSAALA